MKYRNNNFIFDPYKFIRDPKLATIDLETPIYTVIAMSRTFGHYVLARFTVKRPYTKR